MAKVIAKPSKGPGTFEKRLATALRDGLKAAGVRAEVDSEPVRGTKLRRVYVTAKGFENLRASERQDLVWRIVGFSFPPEDQLKISMILTLTPVELGQK